MKLASFLHNGRASYGVVDNDSVMDIGAVLGSGAPDLKTFLKVGTGLSKELAKTAPKLNLDSVALLPPIPNSDRVFGIGYNYQTHIAEVNATAPEHPFVFVRFADSQIGSGGALIKPQVTEKFDYQGALAVVIGREGRRVPRSKALDYVAGYSCYNDASVRDWQRHSPTFTAGKNFEATGGFGPWLVTSDELTDPSRLTVVTRHNGDTVQSETVGNMLFDVAALIEYLSTFTTLHVGDVIVTGTPGGVGARQSPPRWLVAGTVVEVEIEGIGVLRNTVVDEAGV